MIRAGVADVNGVVLPAPLILRLAARVVRPPL
jgi:hypothetical protein